MFPSVLMRKKKKNGLTSLQSEENVTPATLPSPLREEGGQMTSGQGEGDTCVSGGGDRRGVLKKGEGVPDNESGREAEGGESLSGNRGGGTKSKGVGNLVTY